MVPLFLSYFFPILCVFSKTISSISGPSFACRKALFLCFTFFPNLFFHAPRSRKKNYSYLPNLQFARLFPVLYCTNFCTSSLLLKSTSSFFPFFFLKVHNFLRFFQFAFELFLFLFYPGNFQFQIFPIEFPILFINSLIIIFS